MEKLSNPTTILDIDILKIITLDYTVKPRRYSAMCLFPIPWVCSAFMRLWSSTNFSVFGMIDNCCVLNFKSKVMSKLLEFFTSGNGGLISCRMCSILLHCGGRFSVVHQITTTIPFLEFSIQFQSNNSHKFWQDYLKELPYFNVIELRIIRKTHDWEETSQSPKTGS